MRRWEIVFMIVVLAGSLFIRLSYNEYGLRSLNLASANFDAVDYHWLAKNLCRMRGYRTFWGTGHEYHLLRSPGYPLYAALVYSVFGVDVLALRIVDALLSTSTVLLLYLLAKRLFGTGTAVVASLIALLYHQAVNYATRIFSENLFCFMLLLLIYLLIQSNQIKWRYAAAGLISGCMLLIRPLWMGAIPFLVLWIALSGGQRLARSALFMVCLCLILMPWVAYCVWGLGMDADLSIFSTTVGAENTWAAHNPALGDFVQMGPTPGRDFEHEWRQLRLIRFANWRLSESDYMGTLGAQAKAFFLDDPVRCIVLGFKRVYRHWLGSGILDGQGTILEDRGTNPTGVIHWKSRFLDPRAYLSDTEVIDELVVTRRLRIGPVPVPFISFEGVFYVMVAGGLLCGLLNLKRLPGKALEFLRKNSLILLIATGYTLTNVLGITVQRYRFPLDYFIILFCAAGMAGTCRAALRWSKIGPRERTPGIGSGEALQDKGGYRIGRRRAGGLAICTLLIACLALAIWNLEANRRALVRRCGEAMTPEERLARLQALYGSDAVKPDGVLDYNTAWEKQMTGMGDLGAMRGMPVLWTGEATYINPPSEVDFHGEVYLREAQERFEPDMQNPGFFRLIVDSYRDPDSIGAGRAIVVAPAETLAALNEGDRVAVLGRLGGSDYIVGSMIISARAVEKID